MHGLDEVASARLPHVVSAGGAVFGPCGDGLQDRSNTHPVLSVASGHDGGAVAGAVLATRDSHPEEVERQARGRAAVGVVEVGVARVDHQVVGGKVRGQCGQHVIDGGACRDHQDDRAGRLNGVYEVGQRVGGGDVVCKRSGLGLEGVGHAGRAVPDGDGEALFGDVQRKGRAHRAKADEADVRFHGH